MSNNKPVKPGMPQAPSENTDVSRRRFLQGLGAGTGMLLAAPGILYGMRGHRHRYFENDLFTLGVASGDPSDDSVVIWTRLAPDPLNGGGMHHKPVPVKWEVATDPGMARIIRRGVTIANPHSGHVARAVVRGLPSNSWLYYRFTVQGKSSVMGRTRTFPGHRDHAHHLRFAVANCQNYQQGFYTAYADMLDQDLDCVIHVGDYIYESGPTSTPIGNERTHNSPEIFSVEDYRNRYALYKMDPYLQAAHAQYPFIVTWDDHEVDNNYAGTIAEESAPYQGEEFLQRRRNGYQVYAETMPMRPQLRRTRHGDAELRLTRKLSFGNLVNLHMLDTRQYRSDQPCDDNFGSLDPDSALLEAQFGTLYCPNGILDPSSTMLGASQEAWLQRKLWSSHAKWNILAQGLMVTRWNLAPYVQQLLPEGYEVNTLFNVDAWDGYRAAQQRLQNMLHKLRPNNPIILTGDIHSAWAANIPQSYELEDADVVAAEFVSTSIASTFSDLNPAQTDMIVRATLAKDPSSGKGLNDDIEFFNGLFRGYYMCDITAEKCTATFRAVGDISQVPAAYADYANGDNMLLVPYEDSPVETDAVLEIASGFNRPGSGERLVKLMERIPTRS